LVEVEAEEVKQPNNEKVMNAKKRNKALKRQKERNIKAEK
jgi:hypothetical protein